VLALARFVAGLPPHYRQLAMPDSRLRADLAALGVTADLVAAYTLVTELVFAAGFLAVAAVLVWRRSDDWLALFVALMLVTIGTSLVPTPSAMEGVVQGLHPALPPLFRLLTSFGWVAVVPLLCLFPDGRFVPPWTRLLTLVWTPLAVATNLFAGSSLDPTTWPPAIGGSILVGAWGGSIGAQLYRYRRISDRLQRQQTKWVVLGFATAAAVGLGTLLPPAVFTALREAGPPGLLYTLARQAVVRAVALAVPVSLGFSVLRYRLWEVDLVVNRTLVYGALTACVVGAYALVVGGLGAAFQTTGNPAISLVATGLIAVFFQPLRARVQRVVDRLLRGEREDPGQVISRLGRRLEETQADLQRSREQVVVAREEERRRLRRDLHDGLGPTLASVTMKAEAARDLLRADPGRAETLLNDVTGQAQRAVADIRRLVYALRPPALDELGLLSALHEQAAHFRHTSVRIRVDAPDRLPALPAAVEVAAYRIVQEALTNVVRHADARTCVIRLALDGALRLEICDDGRGLVDLHRVGVGITSMRERAAELGGACVVEPAPGGGTRVVAELPLALPPQHRNHREGQDLGNHQEHREHRHAGPRGTDTDGGAGHGADEHPHR
jgi:signal transduction histidine kinase